MLPTDVYFAKLAKTVRYTGPDALVRHHYFFRRGPGTFCVDLPMFYEEPSKIPSGVRIARLVQGDTFEANESIMVVEGPMSVITPWETTLDGCLSLCGSATGMAACVAAANGKPVIDMSARHYPPELTEGLAWAASAGGASGTSTDVGFAHVDKRAKQGLEVGRHKRWEKPFGSIPHAAAAYWSVFGPPKTKGMLPSVAAAWCHAQVHPEDPIVVLTDYEGHEGAVIKQAVEVFGDKLAGVRLDTTGNRVPDGFTGVFSHGVSIALVAEVRGLLNILGATTTQIIATSGFDAAKIKRFEDAGAPVDIYGTGSFVEFWPAKASLSEVLGPNGWIGTQKVGVNHSVHPNLVTNYPWLYDSCFVRR